MSSGTQKLIIRALKEKRMSVKELIRLTGAGKSTVHYHLRNLAPRLTVTKPLGPDGKPLPGLAYFYQIKETQ